MREKNQWKAGLLGCLPVYYRFDICCLCHLRGHLGWGTKVSPGAQGEARVFFQLRPGRPCGFHTSVFPILLHQDSVPLNMCHLPGSI